jgi:hypothetical protein
MDENTPSSVEDIAPQTPEVACMPTDKLPEGLTELQRFQMKQIAEEAYDQKSKQRWESFGVDVSTPQGVLIHRENLDWVRESKQRSETLGKRIVLYLGACMTTLGFVGGFINWALGYFGKHGGPTP